MRQQPANRESGPGESSRPRLTAAGGGALIFLAASFLYVGWRVQPALEYQSFGPFFFRHPSYLAPFLKYPGGLANYAGVFLAQFNCLNWLGAALFTLIAGLAYLASRGCLRRISGRDAGALALLPLFVLLFLRDRYGCPWPAISLGFLLALAAVAALGLGPGRAGWLSVVVSGAVSALLFFVAGLWSAALFAVLCCLWAVFQAGRWLGGTACLALALAAPVAALGVADLDPARLWQAWPKGTDLALAAALYAAVPAAGLALALLPKPAALPAAKPETGARKKTPTPAPRRAWWRSAPLKLATALGLFLLGWVGLWFAFDAPRRHQAEMEYYWNCGQYEKVLAAARRATTLDYADVVRLDLALYHTGRMAEELFAFPQLLGVGPLMGLSAGRNSWRPQSQTLFELGLVNDAEHMAHEALETEGNRPDLLRLLARVNLLKDRPAAARVFLNVLAEVPFQGRRPPGGVAPLEAPPAEERALLAEVSSRMLTNDLPHEGLPVEPLLGLLLAANPTNRMAFEYLMAHYLTNLELKKAMERLRQLDRFHYAGIPRPYEEAMLLYEKLAGARVELPVRNVRLETIERYGRFSAALKEVRQTPESQAALAAAFGDTYWYYYYAARSRRAESPP